MRIFINTDMEGASGFARREYLAAAMGRPDLIAEARKLLAGDINAVIDGCFQAGAEAVTVRDGHAGGGNLKRSDIDDRASFIDGPMGKMRFAVLKEFDAYMQVGSHAMAGTPEAILEHSFSSAGIQNVWMNGRPIGEIGILAYAAAEYGLPCIFVSGDDKACREASAQIPEIVTAEVKKAYSCNGGFFPPLAVTRKLLTEKSVEAVRKFAAGAIPAYRCPCPCTLRIEKVERGTLPGNPPYRVIDGRTYEVTEKSVEAAFFRMWDPCV